MSRHSKNNTASSVFTYAEKQKLQYGTQQERIGKDSMKQFDACCLCLQAAIDPVVCTEGHLFCKGCIYENILTQKKKEALQKVINGKERERERERKEAEESAAQALVLKEFEKTQSSLLPPKRSISSDINEGTSPKKVKTNESISSGVFNVDVKELEKKYTKEKEVAIAKLKEQEEIKKKSQLPSFWIPSLTPQADLTTNSETVKVQIVCTASKAPHPISLKKLTAVRFHKSEENGKQLYDCPSCLKSITNGSKIYVSRNCGHVLCKNCTEQFLKQDKQCFVCQAKCKPKDIILIASDGTGYASAGGNVQVKKWNVAFQG